jgi:hypothetical protein|tara:strand:+ start:49 stop:321 length:273 start_codon:yes stop_codon:yes gene_type:complete
MVKTSKTTLVVCAMLLLGLGGLVDRILSNRSYDALRVTMILEFEGFLWDLEDDVKKNRIDSVVAGYYIHNFGVIYDELTYAPEEYLEWYE